MSTAQTTILPYGQPYGYAGMPLRIEDTQSASNSEASLPIPYGIGVKPGVLTKTALLPTASSSILAGVVLNEMVNAPGSFGYLDQGTPNGVRINAMMTLLTEGRCLVPVSSDTVAGVDVRAYWVFQTAGNDIIGQFRDTDSGNVVDTTKQMVFKGKPYVDASVLTGGTQLICEAYVSISNKP